MGIDVIMPSEYMSLLAWMTVCLILAMMVFSHNWVVFLFSSYFILSSGMLNSKLSQMCGRLYFPIFLLSVHSDIDGFFNKISVLFQREPSKLIQ